MGSILDEHLAACALRNLRPMTLYNRRCILAKLARDTGESPEAVSALLLGSWWKTQQLAPESRANVLSNLKSFYGWLVREGHRTDDPTLLLERPRSRRRLPRPITDVDLALALTATPARVRPWLYLAAFAGLRACEIATLAREDVLDHAQPPVLIVADGKGARQRVVPLHPEVARALARARLPAVGYLFLRLDGKPGPVTAWGVSQLTNRYLHRLGISATLHQCRHWFGTKCYQQSLDLRLTQELMGHANPSTTAGYAAWSPQRGADIVGRLKIAAVPYG